MYIYSSTQIKKKLKQKRERGRRKKKFRISGAEIRFLSEKGKDYNIQSFSFCSLFSMAMAENIGSNKLYTHIYNLVQLSF